MNESVIVSGPAEGRTLLVGGGDYVTYKVRSAETDGAYFCFQSLTSPGFGPPLHRHDFAELCYVLEGSYEFTLEREGRTETAVAGAGTSVSIPATVAHTFRNAGDEPARMLFVHQPAALEGFFEEFGVEVGGPGERPAEEQPPDFGAMAAALERNGVRIVGAPNAIG